MQLLQVLLEKSRNFSILILGLIPACAPSNLLGMGRGEIVYHFCIIFCVGFLHQWEEYHTFDSSEEEEDKHMEKLYLHGLLPDQQEIYIPGILICKDTKCISFTATLIDLFKGINKIINSKMDDIASWYLERVQWCWYREAHVHKPLFFSLIKLTCFIIKKLS